MLAFMLWVQTVPGWPWVGAANPPAHVLAADHPTVIDGRWAGKPARVRIIQTPVANCHAADWLRGAVPDRQDRCRRIGSLDISVGGRRMALSSSGYADLGGVKDIVARFTPTRLILYMRGPDGPDYYGATLEIDAHDVVRRRLDLADGGSEVTVYRSGNGEEL